MMASSSGLPFIRRSVPTPDRLVSTCRSAGAKHGRSRPLSDAKESAPPMVTPTNAPLRTALCDLLGIDYPILKAPMAGGTDTIDLVAVSEAGGLGILGALMLSPDALRAAIRAIRERTDRPFGVNLIVHSPEPETGDVEAVRHFFARYRRELGLPEPDGEVSLPPPFVPGQLKVICDEAVPVLNTMGDPAGLVESAHAARIKVMPFVTTVAEARRAVALGAD